MKHSFIRRKIKFLIFASVCLFSFFACEKQNTNTKQQGTLSSNKVFNYEGLFSKDTILYRKGTTSEYFLAASSDNVTKYRVNKAHAAGNDVYSIEIDKCFINLNSGNILIIEGNPAITNCDNFNISEGDDDIFIVSKYETPINSSTIKTIAAGKEYTIYSYNTLYYDKANSLKDYLWKIDRNLNDVLKDRIIFKSPQNKRYNLLSLNKNISKNFTVHLSIENGKQSKFSSPYILLNDEVSIDFRIGKDCKIYVSYFEMVNNAKIKKTITKTINKDFMRGYFEVSLSKFNDSLKIILKNKIINGGIPETILFGENLFLPAPWSKFAIGNTKKSRGYELQSIMILGREDG